MAANVTKDRKKEVEDALRAYAKKVLATRETARRALEDEGIYLGNGQLAPEYGGPAKH